MDDNAWPHRTLAVEELLESEDITRMDWPAFSPDLNPIEHVWDALGRRIAARLHHPENTQQLKQMLIEEWALLPQDVLHQLVLSMRRRCEATIAPVIDSVGQRNQLLRCNRTIMELQQRAQCSVDIFHLKQLNASINQSRDSSHQDIWQTYHVNLDSGEPPHVSSFGLDHDLKLRGCRKEKKPNKKNNSKLSRTPKYNNSSDREEKSYYVCVLTVSELGCKVE
ncbi:transposable element Tcb2 transposase [Trichonephila clavipes]|nr:transposable element Tcb2 transposase [Trichonephila clavipes]